MIRSVYLLVILLAVQAGLLGWAATRHSPAIDEVGHMAAGLHHWKTGTFDLYRVNPPLVRMLATLPLTLGGVELPERYLDTDPPHRPEFDLGREFVNLHGERAFRYFMLARFICIPFALLGTCVCYWWARDLYGDRAGLLAAVLWCLCPNVLANGQMITPDTGAAALGAMASYLFWRWLQSPVWPTALAGGVVLGLAELCKLSCIFLFALWPILGLVYWLRNPRGQPAWYHRATQLGVMLLVGIYILNSGYGLEGTGEALGKYHFVSRAFTVPGEGEVRQNRFAGTVLAALPVPLPRNYLMGIDVQKRDFERGLRSYLRGEWRRGGWWYYYLYGLAIKTPLGSLTLTGLAVLSVFFRTSPRRGWRDELVLLAPAITLLALVSSQTGFNHHLRYVLPALPFLFIWISRVAAYAGPRHRLWRAAVTGAVVCSVASSLAVYPHSLSYFNEAVGGPMHGSEHLVDSSLDWGQDLLYMKAWLADHPEARPLGLAYFGYIDPRAAGIEFTLPPKGPGGPNKLLLPDAADLGPRPGWYAVSVTLLRGYFYPVANGTGRTSYLGKPYYTRLFRE